MEQEEKTIQVSTDVAKSYSFLSAIRKGQDITVRDDIFDFQLLLDAIKRSQRMGVPFRIVDSGSRDIIQLEWLAAKGAVVYTSDDAERELSALMQINKACQRGNSFLAYFHNGPLIQGNESSPEVWERLMQLAAEGTYVFLSNRDNERDVNRLGILADQCQRGGSWFVYYHHGDLQPDLEMLARNGAWIHVEDSSLKGADDYRLLLDVIHAAHSAGTNCVLHLERELEYYPVKDLQETGAIMLFKSQLIDFRSPLKPLHEKASNPKLDARAYYLYSSFFF